MGITGLLPALKSITQDVHISEYESLTVGIDAYGWLHRGAYTCSVELALGLETDGYIKFCVNRIELLKSHNITPIMVFDGASLPIKRPSNNERRQLRHDNKKKAMQFYEQGNKEAAYDLFRKSIEVTHVMAHKLLKELQKMGVQCVVSPYEADAQLAYMSIKGIIDVVITEDSDTLPYGCRRVLFKMDYEGKGKEIQRRNLGANETLSFVNWTDDMFLNMCVLTGCDYLQSLPGLGLKTAYKLVHKYRVWKKILQAIPNTLGYSLPDSYVRDFFRARLTFRYHKVYDPILKEITTLTQIKPQHEKEDLSFLGESVLPEIAMGVADGDLCPHTHQLFSPDKKVNAAEREQERDVESKGEAKANTNNEAVNESLDKTEYDVRPPIWTKQREKVEELRPVARPAFPFGALSETTDDKKKLPGQEQAKRMATEDLGHEEVIEKEAPEGDGNPMECEVEKEGVKTACETQDPGVSLGIHTDPFGPGEREDSSLRMREAEGTENKCTKSSFFPSRIKEYEAEKDVLSQEEDPQQAMPVRDREEKRGRLKKTSLPIPFSSTDFVSPVISDKIETLHRRKRRLEGGGASWEEPRGHSARPLPLFRQEDLARVQEDAMDMHGATEMKSKDSGHEEENFNFVPHFYRSPGSILPSVTSQGQEKRGSHGIKLFQRREDAAWEGFGSNLSSKGLPQMHDTTEVHSEYSGGNSPYHRAANPMRPASVHELFNELREEAGFDLELFSSHGIPGFGQRSQPLPASNSETMNLAWPFAKPKNLQTPGEPFSRARELEQTWDLKLIWGKR